MGNGMDFHADLESLGFEGSGIHRDTNRQIPRRLGWVSNPDGKLRGARGAASCVEDPPRFRKSMHSGDLTA